MSTHLIDKLRPWAFVFLSALVMVVSSERVFWYYTDASVPAFLELGLFYGIAVYALCWFLQRYRATTFWSFFLAVPVFGYVVEGVITPVIYSGGPTPFFPIWFTAWHGMLGAVLLWFCVRRWLVTASWRPILATSIGLGLFWGTWATTMWLPENLEDPELLESAPAIRDPADFFTYALATGAVLIASHWMLGRGLWIRELPRSRVVEVLVGAVVVLAVGAYSLVYVWAAPMFIALVGSVVWVMRRHERSAHGPTVFEQLSGPIDSRSLAMLVPLPLVAAASYAAWFRLDPPVELIRGAFLYGTIGVQTLAAAIAVFWSWRSVLTAAGDPIRDEGPYSIDRRSPTMGRSGWK